MIGPACQFPNNCQACGYGLHCRRCNAAAHMRRLNADPAFRAASALRGAQQLLKLRAGAAYAETSSRGSIGAHVALMRHLGVPAGAEAVYRLARKNKLTRQEAVEMARRESEPRERICGSV